MTQISEMGVMYRRVTGFIKEREDEPVKRGMIEQARIATLLLTIIKSYEVA